MYLEFVCCSSQILVYDPAEVRHPPRWLHTSGKAKFLGGYLRIPLPFATPTLAQVQNLSNRPVQVPGRANTPCSVAFLLADLGVTTAT